MARVVRAKYENGVLKPLEKLDLEEGTVVLIEIKSFKGFTKDVESGIKVVDEDPVEKLVTERR